MGGPDSSADFSPAVTVAVPGSCGELIQGWFADWERPVLVSCPIACYSLVTVRPRPTPLIDAPEEQFKIRQAARLALDRLGRPDLGAWVRVRSALQPGRGMASSTADVVGVMAGLALALDRPLSAEWLARLACQIEPSDSIMFGDLALLAYRDSGLSRPLGPAPALPLLMLDPGLAVDTLAYNARLDMAAVRRLATSTGAALDLLSQGLMYSDMAAVGAAATLSAMSYQAINYQPLIEPARRWGRETGALGLVRAHSGSVVGLLYPPGMDVSGPARWLAGRFEGEVRATHLTGGGYRRVDEEVFEQMD